MNFSIKIICIFSFPLFAFTQEVSLATISQKYAPILIAPAKSFPKKFDYLVSLDFDGDWNVTNNILNSEKYKSREDFKPTLYTEVTETNSYYIIMYMPYRLKDVKLGRFFIARDHHPHDTEAIFVIVEKASQKVIEVISKIHNVINVEPVYGLRKNLTSKTYGETAKKNKSRFNNFYAVDWVAGTKASELYRVDQHHNFMVGNHPLFFSVPRGHAIYPADASWFYKRRKYKTTDIHVPANFTHCPSNYTTYQLINLVPIIQTQKTNSNFIQPINEMLPEMGNRVTFANVDGKNYSIPTKLASPKDTKLFSNLAINTYVGNLHYLLFEPAEALAELGIIQQNELQQEQIVHSTWDSYLK